MLRFLPIIQMCAKNNYLIKFVFTFLRKSALFEPKFCTCHDSWTVMVYAKFWPKWKMNIWDTIKYITTELASWFYISLVRRSLAPSKTRTICGGNENQPTSEKSYRLIYQDTIPLLLIHNREWRIKTRLLRIQSDLFVCQHKVMLYIDLKFNI